MELVRPSKEYKESFIEAVREFHADTDYTHRDKAYKALSIQELERDFDSFVEMELSHERGENLPAGYIPCTDYWLVEGDKFIGHLTLRHHLTESLTRIGGHVGYDIRPSMRRRGYGTEILKRALVKAKERGIMRVLVTCDIRNIGSRKIIEANGGILENQIPNPEMGHDALRYWIHLQ